VVSRTLILGGGFGGLAVAHELRRLAGDEHEIVLVDRAPEFSMGLRKLWELVGHSTIAEGSRPRAAVRDYGVRFVEDAVTAVDLEARSALVGGDWIAADYVVVALGAEPRPELVPGLAEHGYDVWEAVAVGAAAERLAELSSGRVAILIAGVPYTCPPAPYECAMLVDEVLRVRGVRDVTELSVATVQPLLMPNAGKEGSDWIAERLRARGIEFAVGRQVERVERERVVFADGELEFDLLIGVPPHRVPPVVADSDLAGERGWVSVDRATLATRFRGIYAIGDVTQIVLANGLPLPKAGIIAEREGLRVAAAIAAEEAGASLPPAFDGRGFCFVEVGTGEAAMVEGDFFADPEPHVELSAASSAHADEKRRFEAERLERWFGR
jgi:sulfide:quinone oxidoreductase